MKKNKIKILLNGKIYLISKDKNIDELVKDLDLKNIVPYIDWSPFFWTWEIRALFPKVLEHKKWGPQATELYNDAMVLLKDIVKNKRFKPKCMRKFWPAQSDGDDILIYDDEMKNVIGKFSFLRQQNLKKTCIKL